jgi:hypothetical protein
MEAAFNGEYDAGKHSDSRRIASLSFQFLHFWGFSVYLPMALWYICSSRIGEILIKVYTVSTSFVIVELYDDMSSKMK